jgi:SAM-dependent methyltransferase
MNENKAACYLCGQRMLVGFESYGWLTICKNCGLVYNPDLVVDPGLVMEHFYDEKNLAHRKLIQTVLFRIALDRWNWLQKRISVSGQRLLEIGCGTGEFLVDAEKSGWNVEGVELSKSFCKAAKDWYQLDIHNRNLVDVEFEDESFDVIVLLHVFEHLTDPLGFLEQLSRLVKPGGWLFIVVPNLSSWTDRQFGGDSPTIIKMDHFFHYRPDTLKAMISRSKFSPRDFTTYEPPHHIWTSLYGYLASLKNSSEKTVISAVDKTKITLTSKVKSNVPYWLGTLFSVPFVPLRYWLQRTHQGHEIYMLCQRRS